jgi:predicted nucleotidyltransferase
MPVLTKPKPKTLTRTWEVLRPKVTDELLGEITRRIVEKFRPHQVVLFGSYVWGKPNIYSDIDLLVILDSSEPMVERMIQVADEAEVRFLPMDVLVYTPAELEERLVAGDHFFKDIMSRGKVLYDRGVD